MNTEEDETEHKDKTEWSSFEQYEDSNRLKPEWDLQSIEQIIWKLHPSDEKQCNENGDPFEEPLIFKDISFFISDCTKCSECDNDNSTKNTQSYWNSGIKNENFKMSCSYLCELLKYSSIRKKYINHRTASWKKYIDLLPLKTIENNNVAIKKACNSSPCISPLASDASDSEESDIDIADPMYSKFAVLRKNGFYISEDGLVFCNPYELEEYNRKMMGMSQVLQDELDFITAQHQALKAKKSEERKLLSSQMDSVDSDATEEIHETQRLNGNDKASKTERKSALFSSIQDVFTYARTGIQGFFDKNNPSSRRESKPRCDSDNEDEEPRVDMETHKVEELEDNHDEFTRQMTEEGGLKYQSSDNTVQQLSYQSLPPPLCLDTLPTSNSKS